MGQKERIKKIVLLGCGNVSCYFAEVFSKTDVQVVQAFTRTKKTASDFNRRYSVNTITSAKLINKDADLYIVALPDGVMENVLSKLQLENFFIVHTSGSMPLEFLTKISSKAGVFYPLQSFSGQKISDYKDIPLLVESNSKFGLQKLTELGNQISNNVLQISSEQRLYIHIAAVFASNFSNHIIGLAQQILREKNVNQEVINPLIKETFRRLQVHNAFDVQTGPAKRNDKNIISKHLEILKKSKKYYDIYKLISDSIFEQRKNG